MRTFYSDYSGYWHGHRIGATVLSKAVQRMAVRLVAMMYGRVPLSF